MKTIRRHKQSISLLMIAGVLLIVAFIISLQTRPSENRRRLTATPNIDSVQLDDIPACEDMVSLEAEVACNQEAVQIAERLVMSLVDELLALEMEAEQQTAFIEAQITWEDSRDADCAFVRSVSADETIGELNELNCLLEYNLLRLEQLERFCREWYELEGCEFEVSGQD